MTEFDNLKNSYASAIQFGLVTNFGCQSCKTANEIIHRLCETYVDNSDCLDKATMKQELAILKESFSQEIEAYYQHK